VRWVLEANSHLGTQVDVIKKSFKVCGISNALDGSKNAMIHCAGELPDLKIPYGDTSSEPDDPFRSTSDDSSCDDWEEDN
jgi:hypothetical protein